MCKKCNLQFELQSLLVFTTDYFRNSIPGRNLRQRRNQSAPPLVPAPVVANAPVEPVPDVIPAPTFPLRRSKRIEERQQREAARQARLVEAAENNEVDWEAFMLQELLVDEKEDQEEENNYENIEDRTIVELQCTEQLN